MTPQRLLRNALLRVGLDVRVHRAANYEMPRLVSMLELHGIKTVLDVGANKGQFATQLLDADFKGKVVSFEPLPDAHSTIVELAKTRPSWLIAPLGAVAATEGTASFNVSHNSVSSSLRGVSHLSTDTAPESGFSHTLTVRTRRLDNLLKDLQVDTGAAFLKVDTQGAEMDVLQGAGRALDQILGVRIEMSLAPLYEGQALAHELDIFLRERGFACWDVDPGFRNLQNGRLLQFDGTYFRA